MSMDTNISQKNTETDQLLSTSGDTRENKRVCPFCKKSITTMYFRKSGDWSCGCYNKECAIGPKTICYDTKEEAEKAWKNAFVD